MKQLDTMSEPAEPLFRDRVPEAAARQLATVLAWLVECELATLELLQSRKSSSAGDLRRQHSICRKAVTHCRELGVQPHGPLGPTPRLAKWLEADERSIKREAAAWTP